MKSFILTSALLAALSLSPPAHAQTTINLQSAPCQSVVRCADVPNDSSGSVLIFGNMGAENIGVILGKPDGSYVTYASIAHANGNIYVGTCPAAPVLGFYTVTSVPLMGGATLSALFKCTDYIAHSGRGPGAHQSMLIVSGVLLVP